MDGPFVPQRRNHAAIWMVALLVAGALVGLAYFLFAEFEHADWFPPEWRHFLNREEALAFGALGLGLIVLVALILYRSGAFSGASGPADSWASNPASGAAPVAPSPRGGFSSGPAMGSGPEVGPVAGGQAFPVVLHRNRRACTGDLYLTPRRLYFVCYRDESVAKANAGRAVAHQFGLLGALIHALATRGGGKKREQDLARTRMELAGLSLEDQITRNTQSLSLPSERIQEINKSVLTGNKIVTEGEKIVIAEADSSVFLALKSWCQQHNVATKGF